MGSEVTLNFFNSAATYLMYKMDHENLNIHAYCIMIKRQSF